MACLRTERDPMFRVRLSLKCRTKTSAALQKARVCKVALQRDFVTPSPRRAAACVSTNTLERTGSRAGCQRLT
jgi:hypothetical protein